MSTLTPNVLDLDYEAEANHIAARLRETTARQLHRRGLVVAISGGIDSSVSCALAVRALGPDRVFTLILPEQDSSDDSAVRATLLAQHLGVRTETVDIAPALAAIGCYKARDAAVRNALPEYGDGWKFKIVIDGGSEGRINRFRLIAQSPDGAHHERDLALADYLTIVAATNFKQRIRKTLEYFHADRLNYGVVGTPNRVEYDQGFFVKNGDGSADVKPIAHLYKSQVYGMARHLGLPDRVCAAIPTTDTYSLSQGQDEFYFALPYQQMDLALWALNHGRPASELASALGVSELQAQAVYDDIQNKRRTTRYLHQPPVLVSPVPELD
jgi:NAD+ synthase